MVEQVRPKAKAAVAVKQSLRKATGHDFRDEFTSYVDASTTVLTGVHAELRKTQRDHADEMEALQLEVAKAVAKATETAEAVRKEAAEAIEQMQANLRQRVEGMTNAQTSWQERLDSLRTRFDATDATATGSISRIETAALEIQERMDAERASNARLGAWLLGIAGTGLAAACVALGLAL